MLDQYKKAAKMLEKYSSANPEITSITFGHKTKNGIQTDIPCVVVGVNEKMPAPESFGKQSLPKILDGYTVDVIQREDFSGLANDYVEPIKLNNSFNSPVLFNEARNWYGAGGIVIAGRGINAGKDYLLSNHHVFPEEGGSVKAYINNQWRHIGTVVKSGRSYKLDVAIIELTPDSGFVRTSSMGIPQQPTMKGDVVFWDGARTGNNQGVVIEVGAIFVNDPILGRFITYANVASPHREYDTAQPGDSGGSCFTNLVGSNFATGIISGHTLNSTSFVPLNILFDTFSGFEYGQVTESDNVSSLRYKLEAMSQDLDNQLAANRALRARVNELEMVPKDIAIKFSNLVHTLDESTKDALGITGLFK